MAKSKDDIQKMLSDMEAAHRMAGLTFVWVDAIAILKSLLATKVHDDIVNRFESLSMGEVFQAVQLAETAEKLRSQAPPPPRTSPLAATSEEAQAMTESEPTPITFPKPRKNRK